MQTNHFKVILKSAARVLAILPFAAVASGQQTINLTAAPTTTTLPDGTVVPMWGYFCGTAVTGSTAACAALNPGSAATLTTPATWSPVVITVPTGQSLTINLTNNLSFTPATGSTTANIIPTSIVITGQVGGGLGVLAQRTTTQSPSHTDAQGCATWFIASSLTPPGVPCTALDPKGSNMPPVQANRVQSFATEVAAGATTALNWPLLRPGTYLLESGTHPSIQVPMGLIGVLVVTTAPSGTTAGTAYPAAGTAPAVPYNAELPLEFSEIDPVQNKAVDLAVRTAGFSETAVWTRMNAFGPVTALTLGNGGSGYTSAPAVTISGGAGSGATGTATVGALVSTIAVNAGGGGTGYSATPTVTITDATGAGATATATVVGGVITAITVTNPGSLYTAPTVTITDTTGTGATATASLAGSYGVIYALNLTNGGAGFTSAPLVSIAAPGGTTPVQATASASITLGGCGGAAHTCYPPAVNYTPFYYLINGLSFNKTNAPASLFPATAGVGTTGLPVTTGISGTVLVRLVNAGLRMHVPSIVGSLTTGFTGAGVLTTAANPVSGFTLIAEDSNPVPNLTAPRVQTDVFMAAGKVFDVMVNVPATPTGATAPPSLPVYDRELSLSGNSSVRDAGMLAYIGVNAATLPVATGTGVFAAAKANNDTYNSLVAGQTFSVTDTSKGVTANDANVYGVTLLTQAASGVVTLNANGTFTYTPNTGSTATSDSFTYCANNGFVAATTTTAASCSSAALTAMVTLGGSTLAGSPTAISQAYTAHTSSFIKIPSPGLLAGNTDPNNLPLTVAIPTTPITGVTFDANGGFTASISSGTSLTFNYTVQNSQGRTASGTATVTFPTASNLKVNVVDAQAYNNCQGDTTCINGLPLITDYRWIIEEDRTFWVDPNCTTNSSITTPGCPSVVGPAGQSTVPTFGVNFHASTMPFVAQGCTGPLSCEGGQTMLDNRPACISTGVPVGCSATAGQHIPAVCDVGNGACRPDPNCTTLPCLTSGGFTPVMPSSAHLDPTKRYYISVLPGDAANPFPSNTNPPANCAAGAVITVSGVQQLNTQCGHTMSGAPVPPACNGLVAGCTPTSTAAFPPVTVLVLPTPLPPGKLSVIVFEDDFPLNGEQDAGGGVDVLSPNEPGLGGFNLVLWDTYGGLGDVTGQNSYDMFNQPLSNSLAGTVDPSTGLDACPVSANSQSVTTGAGATKTTSTGNLGITGMIVTCPKYESDNATLSPLAGQALIANLMPEKFSVQAYPGADRIARGEEWLQTNTLDGQHPHDSFIRIGEPGYFQEYGPAGYHVSIGFANPAIINARHDAVCAGAYGAVGPCTNTIQGQVDVQRQSRTPDQRLYPSGSRDALAWTQCWVSLGDPDSEDFMFTKCDANGNFTFTNVPGGNWRITLGDQWNDQIIDGLSTAANVGCIPTGSATTCTGGTTTLNLGNIGVQQWQANLYTKTFIDDNKNGIWDPGEIGIPLVYMMVHYRDGHTANNLTTDFNGVANFNETFPLFNWYVVEADTGRYKTTGIHTVYDAGGPADGTTYCGPGNGARPCGSSTAYNFLANTYEAVPLPADLSVPGAVYCKTADCGAEAASFAAGTAIPSSSTASTGRIDPPWVTAEGWSGETSQGNWIEFGKAPYAACPPACATVTSTTPGSTTPTTMQVAENGGIHGHVTYASTRPFDDASQMIQQPWAPNVPGVTMNLYQEGFAADGVTPTLTLVDTTKTSSWDDWAQGFYPTGTAGAGPGAGQKPYMSCPGQGTATGANADLFFYTLFDQPNYLDVYNSQHNGGTLHTLPYNSQYKCYDAMHIWNQTQPAPYDGMYSFPSSLGIDPTSGKLLAVKGSTNGAASSMNGTNCTICVANPDTTDVYRVGTPMLPPGKYVVEVIMPPGYEVYKEEDKNLLIGDNYIAPVTQQFAGLGGAIFIIPDQASVASLYDPSVAGYNPNNFQNQTLNLGLSEELSGVPGFPGFQDPLWPCVGELRVVPDYLSLFPQAKEVGPFAGATRPLCDRKEVTLPSQMSVSAKFYIFTSTHIASKFTGVITDDFTSEFDPFAPQFGEKFAPPNLPISTKDYLGNEISRVYSDHFGLYDGLTFSSWEVNPPNITGYSPTMMVQCMNDPGPIMDTNASSPTFGQLINDPLYNPAYSDFCYEEAYMPGLTTYLDTPVVPTQAFVGAGYNNADCAYPDATPAIKEVDGDGIGPWVSVAGNTLTITALGDQQVPNAAYSGPSASVAPFNQKTINRHYGFGSPCTAPAAGSATCNTITSVTIGGAAMTNVTWSDTVITGSVPTTGVPNCQIQQQAQYVPAGTTTAQCGQLVITAGNGKQSVDAVTVTIGGKAPVHVASSATIQSAIDAAAPGDLIVVDPTCTTGTGAAATVVPCTTAGATKAPGSHTEMVIMWKPVRLQGVGAASTIINANTHPAGKMLDPWRRHLNCLFGLTLQGAGMTGANAYDPTGQFSCPETTWKNFSGVPENPQVDRLPSEALLGWDATVNGNLAELLQEPSLLGAYEGAGITVLGRGVDLHGANPWDVTLEAGYPTGSTLLSGVVSNPGGVPGTAGAFQVGDANPLCHNSSTDTTNPFPSNYVCNPSSIDGLSVTNSSQGGGGVFVHGWAHYLEIANNRVYNNAGTLSGGISVGQGEFGPPYIVGGGLANLPPGSCSDGTGFVTNQHLPWCLDLHPNVHNNMITANSSIGDELFSATLSGGGGATVCTGNDYYKFNYNLVCGNVSAGEGGGIVHLGEIFNGDIEHNSIVFNQSSNPTIPTNGGGIMVQGTPDTDPVCVGVPDADCPAGLSDGTGPGLVINANLIQGNSADSGSGGGIRLQQVNGTEVSTFYNQPQYWHDVTVTNNIIVNNMAGWDGAGISLQDALNVNIVNNTIAHNDTLATSGVLTNSLGAPLASAPLGGCTMAGPTGADTASCPQSAGLTSTLNSTLLNTTFTGLTLTCPTGHPNCQSLSNPILYNDIFWQNRSFYAGVGNRGSGSLNQQNLVSLYTAFTTTLAPTQTATGACSTGTYWDIGVRGDRTLNGHESGFTLQPIWSLTSYSGQGNVSGDPIVVSQYCNGSRVPPECSLADGCGGLNGFGVPPGISDAVTPNPVFSLVPSATVDEGNNWINVSWGPLGLSNPSGTGGSNNDYGGGPPLGNYAPQPSSPVVDHIPCPGSPCMPLGEVVPTPPTDFFGNPRPNATGNFDIGAVETGTGGVLPILQATVTPSSLSFGTARGPMTLTVTNTGNAALAGGTFTFGGGTPQAFARATPGGGSCGATLAVGASCTFNVVFTPPTAGTFSRTLTVAYTGAAVTPVPVSLTGTGVSATTLTPATWNIYHAANCPGTGPLGILACTLDPAQVFTLTNTGNVPLTGITQGRLSGANTADFLAVRLLSTCGPATGGQLVAIITLAPGATCTTLAQFKPLTAEALGAKTVTLSITDLAGTQTAALNGTDALATATFGPAPVLTTTPATTATKTGTITVSNAATAAGPLILTANPTIAKVGTAGGTFSITTGGTCVSGAAVAAGASCTINVQYAPGTSTATATAHVTIAGDLPAPGTLTSANFTAN